MAILLNERWPTRLVDRRFGPHSHWGRRYRARLASSPKRMAREVPAIAWIARGGIALGASAVWLALAIALGRAGGLCASLSSLKLVTFLIGLAVTGFLLHIFAEFFRDFVSPRSADASETSGFFIGVFAFATLIGEGLL